MKVIHSDEINLLLIESLSQVKEPTRYINKRSIMIDEKALKSLSIEELKEFRKDLLEDSREVQKLIEEKTLKAGLEAAFLQRPVRPPLS